MAKAAVQPMPMPMPMPPSPTTSPERATQACAADSSDPDQASSVSPRPADDDSRFDMGMNHASEPGAMASVPLVQAQQASAYTRCGGELTGTSEENGERAGLFQENNPHVSDQNMPCAMRSGGRGRGGRGRGGRGKFGRLDAHTLAQKGASSTEPALARGRGRGRGTWCRKRKDVGSPVEKRKATQANRSSSPTHPDVLHELHPDFVNSPAYGLMHNSFADHTPLACCSSLAERPNERGSNIASSGFAPHTAQGHRTAQTAHLGSGNHVFEGPGTSVTSAHSSYSGVASGQPLVGQQCCTGERPLQTLCCPYSNISRHEDETMDMHDPDYGWLHHGSMFLTQRVLIRIEREPGEMECLQEGVITKWRPRNMFLEDDMTVR
jgi:hypothetical protein